MRVLYHLIRMRTLILFILSIAGLYAQTSPEYTKSIAPPTTPYTYLMFRDGSNNIEYICRALSNQQNFTWTISAATLTSITDATNVATVTTSTNHGLAVGNSVSVYGSTTAALNGGYIITAVPTPTTFRFSTTGVADGTYNNAALGVATTSPRSNANIWSIQKFYYTTTYMDRYGWAESATAVNKSCDNRANYAYN